MKRSDSLWMVGGISLGLAIAGAGCYVRASGPPPADATVVGSDGTVYPNSPPPDPIPEYPPPSPGWGYSWIAGYWDWSGYDWNWEPGYWAPQEAGYAYIGPRFVFVDGRPVYYRPYWHGPGGRVVYGYGPRGAPPVGFRARPSVAPHAWRAEPAHNSGWHSSPGAGNFHGGGGFRAAPAAPAGGGFRAAPAAPAGGGGFRAAPAAPGGGGFRAAPAPSGGGFHQAPAQGGGGFRAAPAPHGGGGPPHRK